LEGLRWENVNIFYGHLEYFTNFWDILWPFGTSCVQLIHFSGLGIMYVLCNLATLVGTTFVFRTENWIQSYIRSWVTYNASDVNIYVITTCLLRFENTQILWKNAVAYYNAVNWEVVGLAPGKSWRVDLLFASTRQCCT
jgi:hypothetical protein